MRQETHRVTVYSDSIISWTDAELVAEKLYLFDHDASALVGVSGMYRASCKIAGTKLRIESPERTATLVNPYAVSVESREELGTYEIDLYVSDEQDVGVYLATPDPAFSDYRGVIAHTPTERVYKQVDAPPQEDDPLFDADLGVDMRTERKVILQNVETDVQGVISETTFKQAIEREELVDVVPVAPMTGS